MNTELKYIGERIKTKRLDKGITQEELAEAADISTSFIGLVERGVSGISLEPLIKIAEILEVSTDELLLKDVEPPPTTEPTSKSTLITLIKNGTDAEADFMLEFHKLYKRQKFFTKQPSQE